MLTPLACSNCVRMKKAVRIRTPGSLSVPSLLVTNAQVPRCRKWFQAACRDVLDVINCGAAISFCNTELFAPFLQIGGRIFLGFFSMPASFRNRLVDLQLFHCLSRSEPV
jgi:hypothetical protein